MKKYGAYLREARKNSGYTQVEVSKGTKIAQSNLSAWEKDINVPNIESIEILADFYGITIDELVGHDLIENNIPDLSIKG